MVRAWRNAARRRDYRRRAALILTLSKVLPTPSTRSRPSSMMQCRPRRLRWHRYLPRPLPVIVLSKELPGGSRDHLAT
jgi:hypothetical protein